MCLPSMTWSSIALATPNANTNKAHAAFLIISFGLQFRTDKVEMFSEVEIEILKGVKGTELTEVFCFIVC